MPRVSEFEWRGSGKPRRKLWPLLLVGVGLATTYFFAQPDRDAPSLSSPSRTLSDTANGNRELVENEASAIADAAQTAQPDLAQNESSTIAAPPLRVDVINAPPKEVSPPPSLQSSQSYRDLDETASAPNYSALRREMLRHLP